MRLDINYKMTHLEKLVYNIIYLQ
ncbi:hypothetical protein, partial [Plasmodium yoelii yoelii]